MAEPQYVVIAGFPNADFMVVALDKEGVAITEKTFKPVDFMREMEFYRKRRVSAVGGAV